MINIDYYIFGVFVEKNLTLILKDPDDEEAEETNLVVLFKKFYKLDAIPYLGDYFSGTYFFEKIETAKDFISLLNRYGVKAMPQNFS